MSAKNSTKKARKQIHRFYPDERQPNVCYPVPCSPGKVRIRLERNEMDFLMAVAGCTHSCMNSNCINRLKHLFPHPVLYAEVMATSVFIIDKKDKNGQPSHCWRYRHNDRVGVHVHDKFGPNEIVKRGEAEKMIVLTPPKLQPGWVKQKGAKDRERVNPTAPHKHHPLSGARGRWEAAGFVHLP